MNDYPEIGFDNTTVIWKKKQRLIKDLNIKIIVPSNKMFEDVKKSPILKNKEVFIIPNGIDTKKFKPNNKIKAKQKLKVSNKFSVLFIAQVAFGNFRKGTHIVKEILDSFKESENLCKNEYRLIKKKFPPWNFQENKEKWPEDIKQKHRANMNKR